MATKPLYVLTRDNGDGSYSTCFTMNTEWIIAQEARDDICWPDTGCDGDGFHYKTLQVPEECTLESLGIRYDCAVE